MPLPIVVQNTDALAASEQKLQLCGNLAQNGPTDAQTDERLLKSQTLSHCWTLYPFYAFSIRIPNATRTHLFSLAPLCLPHFLNGGHDDDNKVLASASHHQHGGPKLLPPTAPRDPQPKRK